jgi:hypothetical protein
MNMYHAPPMQPMRSLSAVDPSQGSGVAGVLVFAAMAAGMFWLYGKGSKMDWADMNRVHFMETRRRMPRLDVDRLDTDTILRAHKAWIGAGKGIRDGEVPMLTPEQKETLWVVVAVIQVYRDKMEESVFGSKWHVDSRGRTPRIHADFLNNMGTYVMESLMKKWPRYSEGEEFPDVPTLKSNRKKRRR